MSNNVSASLVSTPKLSLTLSELFRATKETFSLPYKISALIKQTPSVKDVVVLTLPGYGGGDSSMLAIKYALKAIGCETFELQLGRNLENKEDRIKRIEDAVRFREKMSGAVIERIRSIHQQTDKKVVLVGWSMGGCYALDAAQIVPDMIEQVITLGTPFGDPRGTSMWNIMRTISRSQVPVEDMDFSQWLDKCEVKDNGVRFDIIYSDQDGIVSTDIARLADQANIHHHKVNSSHVGFAVNDKAINTLLHLVASHEHDRTVLEQTST
jgi:hypothetical protein